MKNIYLPELSFLSNTTTTIELRIINFRAESYNDKPAIVNSTFSQIIEWNKQYTQRIEHLQIKTSVLTLK